MALTNRDELFACDGCGGFRPYTARTITAFVGPRETLDFCDGACFAAAMARGGHLARGRGQVLLVFGMTPAEHWRGALRALSHNEAPNDREAEGASSE